ncbi:MAG: glycosyltransferase [candidate division NC10 bacterium]|nr:glycosyltransferase [candidate division NC10 bacterium]MDE2485678.1 glycosyltransferase [candidate division NC10 bacterium]
MISEKNIPTIEPVPTGVARPMWSVMIPTYNCARYLRQTLESVLAQDQGSDQMQIEVVDDCSIDDPEAVVREVRNGRVDFYCKNANDGATNNFNTCIQRSRGHLVHILHGDDFVLPGFYKRLGAIAEARRDMSLIASRSFFVDAEGIILAVTERLCELEAGSREVNSFFYGTPIQTPGVVVRRTFYERYGGFLPILVHAADCEMWARVISSAGGLVIPEVLACYRSFTTNDSGRLARSGENLRDLARLNEIFAGQYSTFDREKAARRIYGIAWGQAQHFLQRGDREAANANFRYWKHCAPFTLRGRRRIGQIIRQLVG